MAAGRSWLTTLIIIVSLALVIILVLALQPDSRIQTEITTKPPDDNVGSDVFTGMVIKVPGAERNGHWELQVAKFESKDNIGTMVGVKGVYLVNGKPIHSLTANSGQVFWQSRSLTFKGAVNLTADTGQRLSAARLVWESNSTKLTASGQVQLQQDQNTNLRGESLEWDRTNDLIKVTGQPELTHAGWRLNGERMEARPNRGLFTITGSATATDGRSTARAGKIIYDSQVEKYFLQEKPVFIRGQNELTATSISYDLRTKKIEANGPVSSRIIQGSQ